MGGSVLKKVYFLESIYYENELAVGLAVYEYSLSRTNSPEEVVSMCMVATNKLIETGHLPGNTSLPDMLYGRLACNMVMDSFEKELYKRITSNSDSEDILYKEFKLIYNTLECTLGGATLLKRIKFRLFKLFR